MAADAVGFQQRQNVLHVVHFFSRGRGQRQRDQSSDGKKLNSHDFAVFKKEEIHVCKLGKTTYCQWLNVNSAFVKTLQATS